MPEFHSTKNGRSSNHEGINVQNGRRQETSEMKAERTATSRTNSDEEAVHPEGGQHETIQLAEDSQQPSRPPHTPDVLFVCLFEFHFGVWKAATVHEHKSIIELREQRPSTPVQMIGRCPDDWVLYDKETERAKNHLSRVRITTLDIAKHLCDFLIFPVC